MSDLDRELSVEELEEVAGGSDEAEAGLNGYCPKTNKEGCNTECAPSTAGDSAA